MGKRLDTGCTPELGTWTCSRLEGMEFKTNYSSTRNTVNAVFSHAL
ncbi:unnamed protein product [Ixodes persulcatus]